MNIQIRSNLPLLPFLLAEQIEKHPNLKVSVIKKTCDRVALRHGPDVAPSLLAFLVKAMLPIAVSEHGPDDALPPDQVVVDLGDNVPFGEWKIGVIADSRPMLQSLRDELGNGLGFQMEGADLQVVEENRLECCKLSPFARQAVSWFLRNRGIDLAETAREGGDRQLIRLQVRDPEAARRPARERMAVVIGTDDPSAVEPLRDRLLKAGYPEVRVQFLDDPEVDEHPVGLGSAWFKEGAAPLEAAQLRQMVSDFMRGQGVDLERYPVKFIPDVEEGLSVGLFLPVRACLTMTKRAYGGSFPERFDVTIKTDDAEGCLRLEESLRQAGFVNLKVEEDLDDDDRLKGFRVRCHRRRLPDDIYGSVRQHLKEFMEQIGAGSSFGIGLDEWVIGDEDEIVLYAPFRGVEDGSLLSRMHSPASFDCMIFCEEESQWTDVIDDLKGMGFKNGGDVRTDSVASPTIRYGGAPQALLDEVARCIGEKEPLEFKREKSWSESDDDIWIFLPSRSTRAPQEADNPEVVESQFKDEALPPVVAPAHRFFIRQAKRGGTVDIGDVSLPRRPGARHELAPDPADFAHFCLDGKTAETLEHIAWCVALREPCLLEGETSTSKTSSILFLASALGQPVVRLNLNGQTDTGELVGRYAPEEGGNGWQWLDGLVVQAMRKGLWLILDELNLAEPQVLERLNSVLERLPTLVLTEHDSSLVGGRQQPVHKDFRIFATMNPAEYNGRMLLSPAYRDRWQGYRFVPQPGAREYAEMLRFLLSGRQPEVVLRGQAYRGQVKRPLFPHLTNLVEEGALIEGLSRFHAMVERASRGESGDGYLGMNHKERYVFTRRGLLQVLDYVSLECRERTLPVREAFGRGIQRYFFGKFRSDEDRQAAWQILEAAGLGEIFRPGRETA